MPDQKREVSGISPSRQILLAADKEELVERIETLQADLQRRMELEEEILHQSLQKGTASLQSQVEEASRRFKVAQQELEAFRLEILQAEGDPAAQAPRPYIYEDLAAPPQEGPDRSQLRSLLAVFRRLRDERDRLKKEVEASRADADKARAEKAAAELAAVGVPSAELDAVQEQLRRELGDVRAQLEKSRAETEGHKIRADKATAELAASGVGAATLDALERRIRQELEEARAEVEQLKQEKARAPAPEVDRTEVIELEREKEQLEKELTEARGVAEQARIERDVARTGQARAVEEADALRASNVDFDAEIHRLREENGRLEGEIKAHVQEQVELGRRLAYEQAKSEQLGTESRQLVARLAETARKLEEAKWELENPEQTEGFDRLEKFLEKSRVKSLLEKSVRGSAAMVLELVGAVIGAQERPLEAARDLRPRIQRSRSRRPDLGELRQFTENLKAADVAGVEKVHDALRAAFAAQSKKAERLNVDLDTVELVVPRRPEPDLTYTAIVLFVPELQEFWHGELRNAPDLSAKDAAAFVSEGLSRIPSVVDRSRLRFRMDARFCSDAVVRLLDAKKCGFVLAAPDGAELRAAARGAVFSDLGDGWESAEWIQKGRAAQMRLVAFRHPRATQPTPSPSVPHVFRDPQSAYYVFAVDRKVSPREALEAFASRESSQEREHALLKDFPVNRLLARGADSHRKFLPLFLLSADLLQWYRRSLA